MPAAAVRAVETARAVGFDNITIDLIYGLPFGPKDALTRSLAQAVALDVEHISAYHLTIEPNTRFGRMAARGELTPVPDEESERQYLQVHNHLTAAGYDHYEISNFAKGGFRSRHNSSYWHGAQYLGIGVGAHSFNGDVRHWSQQTVGEYCERREYEIDELTQRDRLNEYVMTSLRCAEGVDLEYLRSCFGSENHQKVVDGAEKWLLSGDVVIDNGRLRIPVDRFLISDAIIESLFDI